MRMSRKRKHRRKPALNKKSLISLLAATTLLSSNLVANAETIDDIRDLMGRDRKDQQFTLSEQRKIQSEWYKVEAHNRVAKMFLLADEQNDPKDLDKQQKKADEAVASQRSALVSSFSSGAPIDVVLTSKTALGTLDQMANSIKRVGQTIDIGIIPNNWEKRIEEMQTVVEEVSGYVDIGDVASELKSPVRNQFYVSSPFGMRVHPVTGEVAMHAGIDLAAPEGVDVLSAWNGTVTGVYESEYGGLTVEIDHSEGLKTRYLHLSKILVSVGQKVSQYERIGLVGSTGRVTGPHLHFETYVEGVAVNPILFFGQTGVTALITYLNAHPDNYTPDIAQLMTAIKLRPDWVDESVDYEAIKEKEVIFRKTGDVPEGSTPLVMEKGYSTPEPSAVISDMANPTMMFADKEYSLSDVTEPTETQQPLVWGKR